MRFISVTEFKPSNNLPDDVEVNPNKVKKLKTMVSTETPVKIANRLSYFNGKIKVYSDGILGIDIWIYNKYDIVI